MAIPIAAAVVGTMVASSILNNIFQNEANKANVDSQEKINAENLAFQREQFSEQKFLNRNQYQLASSDMQKAGINPAMASGGVSLTAGSYQSTSQAPNVNPYQIDTSAITPLLTSYLNTKSQEKIARERNETDIEIAKASNESSERIAQADRESRESEGDKNRFSQESSALFERQLKRQLSHDQIQELKRHNEKLENLSDSQIQTQRDFYAGQLKYWNDQLEQAKAELENAKTQAEKERKLKWYNSIVDTITSISREARGWVFPYSTMGEKQKGYWIPESDIPY